MSPKKRRARPATPAQRQANMDTWMHSGEADFALARLNSRNEEELLKHEELAIDMSIYIYIYISK